VLEPALDRGKDVALRMVHAGAGTCIGVKKDGAFKTLHDGGGLVRAKMWLEVREDIDHAAHERGVRANIARNSAPRFFDSSNGIRHGSVLEIVCLYARDNST
jgi:hypothetical protein